MDGDRGKRDRESEGEDKGGRGKDKGMDEGRRGGGGGGGEGRRGGTKRKKRALVW